MNKEYKKLTTGDQKFYEVDGQLKAEIDVFHTHEYNPAPSIAECRHAVIPVINKGGQGWAVYDRLLCRIVNGVYYGTPNSALGVAKWYNESPLSSQDMMPNGQALGLLYPTDYRAEEIEGW